MSAGRQATDELRKVDAALGGKVAALREAASDSDIEAQATVKTR
jgi:hypothetical protein